MPCLECRATVLNINSGHNRKLMEKCRRLWEYAEFIREIRGNLLKGMVLEEAIEWAAKYCLEHEILADVLRKSQMEVRNMLLEEYDEKAEREYLLKEGHMQGLEQGRTQMIENALRTTQNIRQTALLLKISEEEVWNVAEKKGIPIQKD